MKRSIFSKKKREEKNKDNVRYWGSEIWQL